MATTSGTYSFNYSRDQIINSAARKIGAIASGEALSASALTDFSDALNIMIKAWDASGIHIWTETEGILFFQSKQVSYTVGGNTTDHATETYNATALSVAAGNGASSITVSSIANILNGDQIGITLDDGTLFWTTVNTTPSGHTVSLAAALTDSAANLNPVYNYTTGIIRPLRILSGRRYNFSSAIDTPMDPPYSRLDYRALPNKTDTGTPTRYFYDPRGGANTQGVVFIWPAPPDTTNAMKFTWMRPLQDFNSSANIPDLPNEWLDAIIWSLAEKMAIEFDCTPQRFQLIQQQAALSRDLALGFDREPESYLFGYNADQTGP